MFTLLSLVTSIKDYVEIVHKFIETDPSFEFKTYYDFGSIFTFVVLSGKDLISNILSFQWFQKLWSVPTLIPDIASSMISEISIFDGYFQNTQTFLENPIFYGNNNLFIYCIEKFMIGIFNSIFLCFPTSIAHIITLRRFVMQGLEAGFISGLGTIAGNIVWIGSIIFGLRFVVIPWLSLDLFRYFLGFILIVKYMWDSYTERRMVLEDLSKYKIFILTFLLSFTEQTTIYPFMSNLAIGSDSTILESFPTNNFSEFAIVHCSYLMGILIGSLSLLQFTCWFWENPAFQIYMWFISSLKTTTSIYSKFVNLLFLYLTMICAISNIAYFGLDYTLTNPLGFVHEDRLLDQKTLLETAFLNTKASDRNTRRNRGRHGRRERWKHRVRRYRTFDASLYDQGVYDLLTLEDLNYGFDRFWLRRKIRNHRVRFRFFPGPWMRSFKKQLSRPRLESFMGPRVEFFRILFEQAYHPEFHEFSKVGQNKNTKNFGQNIFKFQEIESSNISKNKNSIYWNPIPNKQNKISLEKSTLRKFLRKANNRMKLAKIQNQIKNPQNFEIDFDNSQNLTLPLFSKYWKSFSKIENKKQSESIFQKSQDNFLFQRFYNKIFLKNGQNLQEKNAKISMFESNESENFASTSIKSKPSGFHENNNIFDSPFNNSYDKVFQKHFSKKERFLEKYKSFLTEKSNMTENLQFTNQSEKISNVSSGSTSLFPSTTYSSENISNISKDISEKNKQTNTNRNSEKLKVMNLAEPKENLRSLQNTSQYRSITLLHPLKFYVQKEQALKKKFQFYGVKLFRNFGIENNAPYFRVMMKKFFYHYKPTLRWERTMRVATMRRARRKSSRIPRKLNVSKNSQIYASNPNIQEFNSEMDKTIFNQSSISKPTHFYSLVDKRASRYRYQIYKDVLQHWYYNPFNRFLLKVDVDSFIRRQPNSYFLTKNDEKFLHFKRQLFSEYYETLRWYTYMQHYSTMKNQIGGTKSLTSRAYNQQFVGTLKKIRHLFNITPSFNDNNVLKFDQPLYNEYNNVKNSQILNTSIIHEELLADDFLFSDEMKNSNTTNTMDLAVNNIPEDLTNQSAKILREYLTTATPIRQDFIQKLLHEKNYWELTKFLFKGQKIRGTKPITNETELVNQEKNYLLNHPGKDAKLAGDQFENMSQDDFYESTVKTNKFKQEIWISLFQKCRNKLYDQEALKNYVSLKKEKYENQKNKHKKYLKNRLERMKKSFETNVFENSFIQENKKNEKQQSSPNSVFQFGSIVGTTSSIQKAMKESILWEKNSLSSSSFQTVRKFFAKHYMLQKMNLRQNRPNLYGTFNSELNNTKTSGPSSQINIQKLRNNAFQQNLQNSTNQKMLEIYQTENLFKQNFSDLSEHFTEKSKTNQSNFAQKSLFSKTFLFEPFNKFKHFIWKTLRMKNRTALPNAIQEQTQKVPTLFQNFLSKMSIFLENPNRNIEFWKKRENALSKRRKIRKTFKRLRNQNTAMDKISFENQDIFIPFDNKNTKKPNRQKSDSIFFGLEDNKNTENFFKRQKTSRSQSWKKYYSFDGSNEKESLPRNNGDTNNQQSLGSKFGISKFFNNWFSKKFLRKRSRLRRYTTLKGRGPIKKRTLREKFKRQFKSLKKYGASRETVPSNQIEQERENKKVELIQFITQRNYEANGQFLKRDQKQRRTRQIKNRVWKKKKQNFAQKRRKLRKRRRSTISKIRVFNKKLQRIQSKKQIQTWWWQTFFPKFQRTAEKTWQLEKNKQIRKQLFDLSEKEILERDQINRNNSIVLPQTQNNFNKNFHQKNFTSSDSDFDSELFNIIKPMNKYSESSLQIGDNDFQPLAIPESFRIREKLVQKEILRFQNPETKSMNTSTSIQADENILPRIPPTQILENGKQNQSFSILENLTQNIMTTDIPSKINSKGTYKFFVGTNPSPFYAGWDESLRKFVITNRLLSRKKCFSCSSQLAQTFFEKTPNSSKNISSNSNQSKQEFIEFSKVPLQGMNAATTLYWQIPFTTYDPDQFFALGMDGFSPLGWRNFSFKHSKQTTKPILVRNFFSFYEPNEFSKNLSKNLQLKILQTTSQTKFFGRNIPDFSKTCTNLQNCLNNNEFEKTQNMLFSQNQLNSKREIDKNFEYRRILKKQKRMKKHPRPPVWFPSGSLSQQVLPVHYIYVFYKRSRFPRDRYIRRRLRSNFPKNENSSGSSQTSLFTKITDFTLRKRAKPRRKYHRKRFILENNQFVLRRSKFRGFFDEHESRRPTSKMFQTLARSTKQEKRNLQVKQRKKILDSKQSSDNLRVRQLRRRVQRQVFRPVWRYYPRSGGFVWPGDYLRLELVKAPQLNETNSSVFGNSREDASAPSELSSSRKIRKKKRRTLQEWQIQPKKYLLEKHNLKVLKKRYEKSGNIGI